MQLDIKDQTINRSKHSICKYDEILFVGFWFMARNITITLEPAYPWTSKLGKRNPQYSINYYSGYRYWHFPYLNEAYKILIHSSIIFEISNVLKITKHINLSQKTTTASRPSISCEINFYKFSYLTEWSSDSIWQSLWFWSSLLLICYGVVVKTYVRFNYIVWISLIPTQNEWLEK